MGMHLPAAFTATGKMMLAALEDEEIHKRLDQDWPDKLTDRSVSNMEQLLAEIQQVRQSGISFDNGQIQDGMFCVGVAIRDFSDQVVAGLALSLIENEATGSKIDTVIHTLKKISFDLSARLGAPGTQRGREA
jgi:DNA-binding IclR family transcriptional regulator